MSSVTDIASRIAEEAAVLPPDKQSAVLDYILSMKQQGSEGIKTGESEGDAAWERIVNDPRPRAKLEAYLESLEDQQTEPMDFDRL